MSDKLEIKFSNGSLISSFSAEGKTKVVSIRGVSYKNIQFFDSDEEGNKNSSVGKGANEKEDRTV